MFFYSIIPILRLPRTAPFSFTYSSKTKISTGTLVRVAFRKQTVWGVVVANSLKPSFAVRPIQKTFEYQFPAWYLDLLERLTQEMFEHPGTILKAVLNKILWRELAKFSSPHRVAQVHKFDKTLPSPTVYRLPEERLSFLSEILSVAEKNKRSLLILIPSLPNAKKTHALLAQTFPDLGLYTSETKGRVVTGWIMDTNAAHLVISTRIGVFLPLRFHTILCDDEPNDLYRQREPSPTYDTRRIADIVSRETEAKLLSSGYSLLSDNKRILKSQRLEMSCGWVDMKQERERIGHVISERSIEDTGTGMILFITSNKAYSRRIECKLCGYEFVCPSCELPYQSISAYELFCPRCGIRDSVPPFCPACQGSQFFYPGIGAKRLKEVLQKDLPKSIRFEISALSEIDAHDISLYQRVVLVLLDSHVAHSHDSLENLVHHLIKLRKLCTGELVIQYYSESLREKLTHPADTLVHEMNIRRKLGFPPFGDLYTVRYFPKTRKTLSEAQAQDILSALFNTPAGSIIAYTTKKRGLPYMTFNVKVPKNHKVNWKKLPQEFHINKV